MLIRKKDTAENRRYWAHIEATVAQYRALAIEKRGLENARRHLVETCPQPSTQRTRSS